MNTREHQISDADREARIESLGAAMVLSTDLTERASLWRRMREEIALRSPEQIRKMEQERGLAR